jgi:hypothetical protein|tara:strand:+ start:697 stop:906 length:210 start_codon:yes stop_codon:yes gene_type:complete
MDYLGIEGYLGYLLMSCIVSFVLIVCSILSLQDKRIKTYKLSELMKDKNKQSGVFDIQSTVKYTEGDNT